MKTTLAVKTCPQCDTSFAPRRQVQRFCSTTCRDRAKVIAPSEADYTVDSDSGCWIWQRYRDRNGYARWSGGWAHRFYFEHHVGPIPEGMQIDHLCNNGRQGCVNPAHLEPVTQAQNIRRAGQRAGRDLKQLEAARLRMQGATYTDIATALQLADRQGAFRAVRAAIRKGLVKAEDIPRRRLTNEASEVS